MNKIKILIIFTCCIYHYVYELLKWAARAEKLPDETALHRTYDYSVKVIVIGAGASGLAAAKVEKITLTIQFLRLLTDMVGD